MGELEKICSGDRNIVIEQAATMKIKKSMKAVTLVDIAKVQLNQL